MRHILTFIAEELFKVAWFGSVLSIIFLVYMCFLIYEKSRNFKLLHDNYGYQVPPVTRPVLGHYGMDATSKLQIDWRNKFGNIHGFYNTDSPSLRITDLNAINEVFVKQAKIFHKRLGPEFRFTLFKDSVLFNYGTNWQKARRAFRQAILPFTTRNKITSDECGSINQTAGTFPLNIDDNEALYCSLVKLIDRLREVSSQPKNKISDEELAANYKQIDEKLYAPVRNEDSPTGMAVDLRVYEAMSFISVDFIMRIGFGLTKMNVLNGLKDKTFEHVNIWSANISHAFGTYGQAIPFLRPFMALLVIIHHEYRYYYNWIKENVTQKLKEHYLGDGQWSEGANCGLRDKTIYQCLYEEYRADRFAENGLVGSVGPLIVAGSDTTTATVTSCIWCIGKYEDLQEKLVEDVRQFGVESEYLDMFVKEVLRMYPPIPNFVVRTADRDTVVQGRIVKKGMSVYLGIEALHHDEKFFPDPYKFDPLRFAKGKKYPPGVYAPFGLGNRMCLGYHLAYKEIKRILCELLKHFSIQLICPLGELQHESTPIFLARAKHDIRVRLIPRSSS